MQMSDEGPDTARLMKIINHPVRLRIIELLASEGPLTWKDLSTQLGVKTGALYHHLDTLENIVTRDSERRYALTKMGLDVYDYLSQNKVRNSQTLEKVMRRRSPLGVVRGIFVPRFLVASL